ncbi:protein of unknown function [Beijerinckiaceae bacterium RH AL1]|nr:protein of unknown function [Beijerinckiaceae bacterium RH CH11]VVB49804.1 protein of unknown function [Beijerinckiaceae bacterium RH AL8]VVC57046.1 protein of unknown function [Beijerinckiaceae bacterium RH AL1]
MIGKWQGGPYGFVYEFLSSGDYILTSPGPGHSGRTNKYQLLDGGRIKFEEAFGFSVICSYSVADNALTVSGCDGYAGTYRKI